MNKTFTAIFENPADAEEALRQLVNAGYTTDDISVLMSSTTNGSHFEMKNNSKAFEGVAVGGVTGGAIGAIVGGLTAVAGVALTGGIGLVAVGPAIAALTAAGAGAGVGGAVGGLVGLGIPEHEAKLVEDRLVRGDVLIAVCCEKSDRAERAREILETSHPETVNSG